MLVSLRALEEHALNLGLTTKSYWAWAFGYGGSKRRLTAISPRGYLSSGKEGEKGTIIERLEEVLRRDRDWRGSRGPEDGKKEKEAEERIVVEDAWMLTMPSFVGWEGINPLTVYFVYSPPEGRREGGEESVFTFVVLEIHNTFGESHVHVLRVGEEEDREELRGRGYDHQWTFPRQFHVSPFNDRSGYYTVGVKRPSHPPTPTLCSEPAEPPKPTVRVQLYTDRAPSSPNHPSPNPPSPDPETQNSYFPTPNADLRGELKLTAILRPTESIPLNGSVLPLLKSLMKMPFDLLLTTARIDYQAFILHYGKPRLDVYLRPEMKWTSLWRRGGNRDSVRASTGGNSPASVSGLTEDPSPVTGVGGGGVKWQAEGLLERYARWKVEKFLQKRVDEVGIKVTLVPANPAMKVRRFVPEIMRTRSTTTPTGHYKEGSREDDSGSDDVEWLWSRNGQSNAPSLPMTPSPGTPRPPLSASSSSTSLSSSSTPTFGNASWQESAHLRIGYLSPKLFTTLLFCPSAEYALLLGCDTEGWFKVSSRHLFINVFAKNEEDSYPNSPTSCRTSCLQRLRVRDIPTTPSPPKEPEASASSSSSKQDQEKKNYIPIPIPPTHFLDRFGTPTDSRLFSLYGFLDSLYFFDFLSYWVIQTQFGLDALERKVFGWVKARVVQGQEPWMAWERAGRVYWGDVDEQEHGKGGGGGIGSVRRPE
ncbi:hypothetical protein H1R20_g5093, partial [Candolleomyces eurysporus]